jgi:hypothetical protein
LVRASTIRCPLVAELARLGALARGRAAEAQMGQEPEPRYGVSAGDAFPLGQCLWIIMNEEWHHHRFAVRDLDAIEATAS